MFLHASQKVKNEGDDNDLDGLIADFKMKDIKDTNKNGDIDIYKSNDDDMKSPLIKRLARGTLPILYKEGVFQTDREGNTIIPGNTKNIPANVIRYHV